MNNLSSIIKNEESFKTLLGAIDSGGCPALLTGVGSVHSANIIAALKEETGMPVAVVCSDEAEAGRLSADVEASYRKYKFKQ